MRAQEAARNFVKTAVQPRDLVGVGTIDNDHGFRLQTAFTTDRELVESAIADPSGFRGNDPLQIANKTFVADLDERRQPQDAAGGRPAATADARAARKWPSASSS